MADRALVPQGDGVLSLMCGVAGFITDHIAAVPEENRRALHDAIRYRGRDGHGEWSDGRHVHFAHSRLSVIDLATGAQPMEDASGRFVIVYNGEIYNYRELRALYTQAGARFRTESDTEVILEGYRLKGAGVCEDLNGMFAFAIWDKTRKELFLARDRLGKKPLYWTRLGRVFGFASTLDAFRAIPGWRPELSQGQILFYNATGAFADGRTLFRDAFAVPPASYATLALTDAAPKIACYWRPDFRAKSRRPLPKLLDEYEALLTDATDIRLRSDVPLALSFSGGVDSGSIAYIVARKLKRQLACYTVDYHAEDDQSEETINARNVADALGLPWHYVHFNYKTELLEELKAAYGPYDQPCQQIALTYARRLFEAMKPYATVVLSGNGADELFTGYVGDEKFRLRGWALEALAWLRPFLKKTSLPPYLRMPLPQAYAEALSSHGSVAASPEARTEFAEGIAALSAEATACGAQSALDLKMFISLRYSGADANFRIPDISGLAAQVEVRSPFLDYRMVEFAARLPHRYKVGNVFSPKRNKLLPKLYYERHVPAQIAWSRKKGMGWNLRWDRSIAHDQSFTEAFETAWRALARAGLDPKAYRDAWQGYVGDVRSGVAFSAHARTMMVGLMLGTWLARRPNTTVAT
jgi:asparagine synthase (glutamine-hydrolysing)